MWRYNQIILLFMLLSTRLLANKSLFFKVPVVEGVDRYAELLTYPSILMVALANQGSAISYSGRLKIRDRRSVTIERETPIPFHSATLQYLGKEGSLYRYEARLEWNFARLRQDIQMRVELDMSPAKIGEVWVRVYPPLGLPLPQKAVDMMERLVARFVHPKLQKQLLDYVESLNHSGSRLESPQVLWDQILFQAINESHDQRQKTTSARGLSTEPGDAESVSDQMFLIITLVIWILVVPLGFAVYRLYRRYRSRVRANPW